MSLVITMYVREGIVMAADSRLTLNNQQQVGTNQVNQVAVGQSDSTYKLFCGPHDIGISTAGDASIEKVPISGYIESFIAEELSDAALSVDEVPQKLLDYFINLPGPPQTYFHVAGYKLVGEHREQHIWRVMVRERQVVRVNQPNDQGIVYNGETDILSRLVHKVAVLDKDDKVQSKLPWYPVPWAYFTLQDAIDFVVYAVGVTIDSLRFQPRAKTVGGPIDVLVIKPDGVQWIKRKELHA